MDKADTSSGTEAARRALCERAREAEAAFKRIKEDAELLGAPANVTGLMQFDSLPSAARMRKGLETWTASLESRLDL